MEKIKIGIVGLGRLGIEHAKNIAFKISNAELIAVCSVVAEEVDNVVNDWGIPYGYTDYYEMIKNDKLDAIAVVSPSPKHVEHIKAAFEAGLHVFTEKPLGVNVKECKKAEKLVEKHNDKVFMLGFMRRYDPSYAYAKQKIKQGAIGKPILVKATSIDPEELIDGAIRYAETSGGLFLDIAVHDIDLVRWFLESEVSSIYAAGGCYLHEEFAKYNDGDNVASLMQFKNGTMGLFHTGRNAPHGYHIETEVVGTLGTLKIGTVPQKNLVTILNQDGAVQECVSNFQERFEESYLNEMQEFVNCIIENRRPDITVYDGTKATEVAYAATEAFRENKLIVLE